MEALGDYDADTNVSLLIGSYKSHRIRPRFIMLLSHEQRHQPRLPAEIQLESNPDLAATKQPTAIISPHA